MEQKVASTSETTPLVGQDGQKRVSGVANGWDDAYSRERLASILEIGRKQSIMLPAVMQPAVNWLILFVETHSLLRLFVHAAAVIALVALGLTCLILWGGCLGDSSASAVYLFMVSTALGGDPPDISDGGMCPYLSVVMTLAAFLINVLGIGLMVNKMTQPKPKLLLSENAIVKMRNGLLVFQCRCLSPHGHYITDLSVRMVSFLRSESLEGEKYMEIREMETECSHRGGVMPVNMNHFIRRDSSLYGMDLHNLSGWIEVILSGYDEFLGARVTECFLYGASNIKVGHEFEDCFIVDPFMVTRGSARAVQVDLKKFHEVKPGDPKWAAVVKVALDAAKQQRDTQKQRCLEVGHEARYYTAPGTCL